MFGEIYTHSDVQAAVLANILGMMTDHGDLIRELFGVQKILDVLRLFYWYTPDKNSLGTQPVFHPITKKVLGMHNIFAFTFSVA